MSELKFAVAAVIGLSAFGFSVTAYFIYDHPSDIVAQAVEEEPDVECAQIAAEFSPQTTPEASYALELEMLSDGFYCFNLPLFDDAWRSRSDAISRSNAYRGTASRFMSRPYDSRINGDFAIVYYPGVRDMGPSFLFRRDREWIIDRSSVEDYIRYDHPGNFWAVYEDDHPYLDLLRQVYDMEEVETGSVYRAFAPR